eukprot:10377468-Ditylum_brightwellii.AAC.1
MCIRDRPLRARLHMPQTQRRPRRRKSPPPKTGVAQKGVKRKRHLRFWRGRALAGIAHRQGKRNM